MLKKISLKFRISREKELSSFFNFLFERQFDGGRNFDWAVLKHHPFFKKFFKDNDFKISKKQVLDYVRNYYQQHEVEIKNNLKDFSQSWKKIESAFLELTQELFPNQSWPKGKYIAYLTIWRMYPRFLEDKTFQIPYSSKKKKEINLIVAHELLHFIFYSYFFKKNPEYRSHKYDFFVWHVSEIFNSIVLKRKEWKNLLKHNNLDYPEHQKIIDKIKDNNLALDYLIEKIVFEVKKSALW